MTDKQPDALRLAELLETDGWPDAAAVLRRQEAALRQARDALQRAVFELRGITATQDMQESISAINELLGEQT